MLKNSPNISYNSNREIFQLKTTQSDEKYDKSAAMQILQVSETL